MKRLVLPAVAVAASLVAASCGVPQSGQFEPINRDEIQFDLDATTTTSSSTVPPTTIDATTTTELAPTTTISTEDVLLYFVSGSQVTSVTQALARPATPSQVLAQLVKGPPSGDIGTGLRSTIPASAALTVTRASGVGIIDLPNDIFDAMPSRDQRLFFAQLVLTIGRLGGIGPVQFTRAGVPASVIRGDGTVTAPGDAVTIDDYAILLSGSSPIDALSAPTDTATTTTTVVDG